MGQWYYTDADDNQHGPLTPRTVADLVAAGVIGADTEVSRDGRRWMKASRVKGLLDSGSQVVTADEADVSSPPPQVVLPDCYDFIRAWAIFLRVAGILCIAGGIALAILAAILADLNEERTPYGAMIAFGLAGLASCASCLLTASLLVVVVDVGRKLHEIAASLREAR